MHRIALVVVSLVLLVACARRASAAVFTGCCACIEVHVATTSGPSPEPAQAALFCSLLEGAQGPVFAAQCADANGGVSCVAPVPGESCSDALAGMGIACPGRPGVPVADGWGLTGLVTALGALGARALRQR